MYHKELIEHFFSSIPHMLARGQSYDLPLPSEINDWYCYITDSGHNVLSIVKAHVEEAFSPGSDPCDYMVPISVKTVLRTYEIINGFVIVDVEYDEEFGVIQEDDDYEW